MSETGHNFDHYSPPARRGTTAQGAGSALSGGDPLPFQPVPSPSISLPKGGGAIRGVGEKFAANPVTGTGSMSVPIPTSPGRSAFGPQLSLSYDSGAGNGPFGFGWNLSVPSITRKTDKGLPKYHDAEESDVFILSGIEDLVPVLIEVGGNWVRETLPPRTVGGKSYRIQRYRPRIEGLFARIERWTGEADPTDTSWRSISKDNVTTWYGKTAESRIHDPSDPARIFSWLICESYDDKGNAVVYEYESEDSRGVPEDSAHEAHRDDTSRTANRYLKRIKHGNRVSRLIQPDLSLASWMFEVVFDYDEGHYEAVALDPSRPEGEQHRFVRASASAGQPWALRPDPFSSYRPGFEVRTYRRCRRLLMFHHIPDLPTGEKGYEGLVRSTELDYADLDYEQPVTIEDELTHEASTRFASFIRRITQSGSVRDDTQPVVLRDGIEYTTYLKKSLPPLELQYSKAIIQDQILELEAVSRENLPAGVDAATYQWVDLHGEGLPGILTEQAGAWFYKRNLSPVPEPDDNSESVKARLAPVELVASKPNLTVAGGHARFMDLAGDGRPDLVVPDGPMPGLYEHDGQEGWQSFRPFTSRLHRDTGDPNLRFLDLDGDGRADVLITEDDAFVWHASLGEEGFGRAQRVARALEEDKGPRLAFADDTLSIYLADMCGDGLTDLVRVRNGEVCYWPNLGYGLFGAKVTMDDAPAFDHPDQFDQRRIRLADIDGSGTTDIIYLHREGVRLYFNQSGNRLSEARLLPHFPHLDNVSTVMTTDLLGNGTACLVWSSPLPGDARRQMCYIDLMGGTKPHLLIKSVNNLGSENTVHYAPSTKFYLADKLAGRPWVTRLPFPVHVVERKTMGHPAPLPRARRGARCQSRPHQRQPLRHPLRLPPRLLRRCGARVSRVRDGGTTGHRGARRPHCGRRPARGHQSRCRLTRPGGQDQDVVPHRCIRRTRPRLRLLRRPPRRRRCRGVLPRTGSDRRPGARALARRHGNARRLDGGCGARSVPRPQRLHAPPGSLCARWHGHGRVSRRAPLHRHRTDLHRPQAAGTRREPSWGILRACTRIAQLSLRAEPRRSTHQPCLGPGSG
jgi:hypothetical protein